MTHRKSYITTVFALLWIIVPSCLADAGLYKPLPQSNENDNHSSISTQEAKSLFALQKTHWDNGDRVSLVIPQLTNKELSQFIKAELGIFPYQLKRRWNRLKFSGRSRPPIIVEDENKIPNKINEFKGGIGFVPSTTNNKGLERVWIKN